MSGENPSTRHAGVSVDISTPRPRIWCDTEVLGRSHRRPRRDGAGQSSNKNSGDTRVHFVSGSEVAGGILPSKTMGILGAALGVSLGFMIGDEMGVVDPMSEQISILTTGSGVIRLTFCFCHC